LGKIGGPKASDFLFSVADNDTDANERVFAGGALFDLGDPRAFDILMKLLRVGSVHLNWASRAYGLSMLGKMQDLGTIPLLVDHLNIDNIRQDEFRDEVRSAAVAALAGMGEPAYKALVAAISDPESGSCEYACYALGNMGDVRALPELERLAQGEKNHRTVRQAAKHAISVIKKNHKMA
jgi:HEAT repeat protein